MKNLVILAFVSGSLAMEASGLFLRDTTEVDCSAAGRKTCGTICIEQSHTCCPDQQGGCPATSVCWLGDNGKYGCCPAGQTCQGSGGTDITTDTVTVPGTTSTVTIAESTTSADVGTETETTSVTAPAGTITPVPTLGPNGTEYGNGTGTLPTSTSPPFTAGAAANGLALSGLLGGVFAVVAALL